MKADVFYRKWRISLNRKPIPIRCYDYDAVHEDYDGPEDNRYFTAPGVEAAIQIIDQWEEE